jgi:hypothetical protein
MNAKKLVSFSSTAVVFSLLHILHGVEWEQLLLKKWKLYNDLFQKTVPEVRLECLMYSMKIPVCTVALYTGTNLELPILVQEYSLNEWAAF